MKREINMMQHTTAPSVRILEHTKEVRKEILLIWRDAVMISDAWRIRRNVSQTLLGIQSVSQTSMMSLFHMKHHVEPRGTDVTQKSERHQKMQAMALEVGV